MPIVSAAEERIGLQRVARIVDVVWGGAGVLSVDSASNVLAPACASWLKPVEHRTLTPQHVATFALNATTVLALALVA